MRPRIWPAACAAIALGTTMTVLAQDPSPQSSQYPQRPQASQSMSAKTITVTGCVQRAGQSATGATGTTGTTGAPAANEIKFVLTNASIGGAEAAGTTGTATPPATAIASEYRLDTDEAKLTEHVGHKVEVTGTVEQPSHSEQKPPASAANAPTLKVSNVKMVSSTCP